MAKKVLRTSQNQSVMSLDLVLGRLFLVLKSCSHFVQSLYTIQFEVAPVNTYILHAIYTLHDFCMNGTSEYNYEYCVCIVTSGIVSFPMTLKSYKLYLSFSPTMKFSFLASWSHYAHQQPYSAVSGTSYLLANSY